MKKMAQYLDRTPLRSWNYSFFEIYLINKWFFITYSFFYIKYKQKENLIKIKVK
jgi:hypothetical protein